ncbi:hypothetical protein GCM10012319_66150 [Comamonas sp. KCTC 72670]|nr:hypothetical protein GCM10012319_66150 [Comamonas sp. KCTC 72670]
MDVAVSGVTWGVGAGASGFSADEEDAHEVSRADVHADTSTCLAPAKRRWGCVTGGSWDSWGVPNRRGGVPPSTAEGRGYRRSGARRRGRNTGFVGFIPDGRTFRQAPLHPGCRTAGPDRRPA